MIGYIKKKKTNAKKTTAAVILVHNLYGIQLGYVIVVTVDSISVFGFEMNITNIILVLLQH